MENISGLLVSLSIALLIIAAFRFFYIIRKERRENLLQYKRLSREARFLNNLKDTMLRCAATIATELLAHLNTPLNDQPNKKVILLERIKYEELSDVFKRRAKIYNDGIRHCISFCYEELLPKGIEVTLPQEFKDDFCFVIMSR